MSKTKKIVLTVGLCLLMGLGVYFIVYAFPSLLYYEENIELYKNLGLSHEEIELHVKGIIRQICLIVFLFVNIIIDLLITLNLWFGFITIQNRIKLTFEEYKLKKEKQKELKRQKRLDKLQNEIK